MHLDLFRIYIEGWNIGAAVSVWAVVGIAALVAFFFIVKYGTSLTDYFSPEVELQVPLGGLGSISIKADYSVSQIAYTAWAELITRKAGLPIDPEKDVILEVYNSWYQLFGIMRELVKTVPAPHLKKENTKTLINLLVNSLNRGLRPHLTEWQAKFNKWYKHELEKPENANRTPQEIQKMYPEYRTLVKDLLLINEQMVTYATELKKLIKLETKH